MAFSERHYWFLVFGFWFEVKKHPESFSLPGMRTDGNLNPESRCNRDEGDKPF
jgi:hypothetical protein